MNCVANIFVAFLAFYSGPSLALSGNSNALSRKNYTVEVLGNCPMNSSISVKVFRNLKGEWLTTFVDGKKLPDFSRSMDLNLDKNVIECGESRYIRLSDFLKDTEAENSSEATVGDYRNNTDGKAYDSCKRRIESPTTADLIFMNKTLQVNLMEARKSSDRMKTMENRMTSVENTLNGTLTIVKESHASVENTLKSMEETISQMNTMLKNTPSCGCTKQFDATVKGKNVEMSNGFRTATRAEPTVDGGHASVVSNSILEDDQVFQIQIDERIEKWSQYGIAIGVIEEKQEGIKDASVIYSIIKGTWAIHSYSGSQPGKSDTWKDGNRITEHGYPLSTNHLPVGTLIGVSRRRNGNLHYYLNGVDKGAAFVSVPNGVFAFVDIMNHVTKISITN